MMACIEGALAASAPCIAVMDADMQHDEKLPQMLAMVKCEPVNRVVGSRYGVELVDWTPRVPI